MTNTCQNCQKEYQPKRRGGRFCSVSCRVSAWEKAQQVGEPGWLYQREEVYLAHKLEAFMKEADAVKARIKALSSEQALKEVDLFLSQVGWRDGNSVVQKVLQLRKIEDVSTSKSKD